MTGTLDSAWNIIGWCLAALTIAALLYYVFGDPIRRRFRKTRRCPKCWYDLSHTPGMTCSECGYTARREKQLFKTRRRKRWIVVFLLLWLSSYFAFRAPAISRRGAIAAIPTTALVFLWTNVRIARGQTLQLADSNGRRFAPSYLVEAPLAEELFARMTELSDLDWRLLVEVALRTADHRDLHTDEFDLATLQNAVLSQARHLGHLDDPNLLRRTLTAGAFQVATRRQWPQGENIRVVTWTDLMLTSMDDLYIEPMTVSAVPRTKGLLPISAQQLRDSTRNVHYSGRSTPLSTRSILRQCQAWDDYTIALGRSQQSTPVLEYTVSATRQLNPAEQKDAGTDVVSAQFTAQIKTRIAGSIEDILTPVIVPEFDAALAARLTPCIHDGHIDLLLDQVKDLFPPLDGATFAVHIELIQLGEVVAAGDAWWCLEDHSDAKPPVSFVIPASTYVDLQPLVPRIINPQERGYTLRLTASPNVALRRFESNRYWSGCIDFTVQPEFDRPPDPP